MEYEDLKIYEKSYKATLAIYRMTKTFPKEEMYGMTSQIRRAATSITLNIAEGYAKRESQEEFKRFLKMSLGSSDEVQVLLEFAKDLEYIEKEQYTRAKATYQKISKMLNGMISKMKSEI